MPYKCVFITGLTDEEVELAIQRSGSTEALPLVPAGLAHPLHAAQLPPAPLSEYIYHFLNFFSTCKCMRALQK